MPDQTRNAASSCECAFCGQEIPGSVIGPMTREWHETFTLLVLADPGSAEYQRHLEEARRILDVQV